MESKRRTTVYLDIGLYNKAKEMGVSFSQVLNDALGEDSEEMKQCCICKTHFDEHTSKGLMWLCPHEKWVCKRCDRELIEARKHDIVCSR